MDDLGFNKIAAAILVTALGFMGLKEISHSAMHVSAPEKPVYSVGSFEAPKDGPVEPLPFPQEIWVTSMDAERGAKVFKKCTSCHNADDGGDNGTGPNLWNVVGAPAGGKAGFAYSGAMSGSGLTWDYEALDGFLKKPSKYLSGTNMNFVGVKKEADRAAVIEYLRVASANPIDRPTAIIPEVEDETPENETVVENLENTLEETTNETVELIEDGSEKAMDIVEDGMDKAEDVMDDVKDKTEDLVEDIKDAVEGNDQ